MQYILNLVETQRGIDERRYFIIQVSDRVKQDHKYFTKLNKWWDKGGKKDLFTLLERIDLSQFNIREVPKTAALEQQKLETLTGLDSWLYELLQDEGRWKIKWSAKDAANDFRIYCDQKGGKYKYENTSNRAVGKGLRKWLVVKRRRRFDSRGRYWELILPELNKAREQFSEKLDVRIDWDV